MFIQKNIGKFINNAISTPACDGTGWMVQYGREEFELDYVDGTDLEKITNILEAAEEQII